MIRASGIIAKTVLQGRGSPPGTPTTCSLSETGQSWSFDSSESFDEEWKSPFGQVVLEGLRNDVEEEEKAKTSGKVAGGSPQEMNYMSPMFGIDSPVASPTAAKEWRNEVAPKPSDARGEGTMRFSPNEIFGGRSPSPPLLIATAEHGKHIVIADQKLKRRSKAKEKVDALFLLQATHCQANNFAMWHSYAPDIWYCINVASQFILSNGSHPAVDTWHSVFAMAQADTHSAKRSVCNAACLVFCSIRAHINEYETTILDSEDADKYDSNMRHKIITLINHLETKMANDPLCRKVMTKPKVITIDDDPPKTPNAPSTQDDNTAFEPELEDIMEACKKPEPLLDELARSDSCQYVTTPRIRNLDSGMII